MMTDFHALWRFLDKLEADADLAAYDPALSYTQGRLVDLRNKAMRQRHKIEADRRVDAMFPSMKVAAE